LLDLNTVYKQSYYKTIKKLNSLTKTKKLTNQMRNWLRHISNVTGTGTRNELNKIESVGFTVTAHCCNHPIHSFNLTTCTIGFGKKKKSKINNRKPSESTILNRIETRIRIRRNWSERNPNTVEGFDYEVKIETLEREREINLCVEQWKSYCRESSKFRNFEVKKRLIKSLTVVFILLT